jgi:hypothetical protein
MSQFCPKLIPKKINLTLKYQKISAKSGKMVGPWLRHFVSPRSMNVVFQKFDFAIQKGLT